MAAYLNQFKRRIAGEKGLANKDNPIDPNGTKRLMNEWGLTQNQPKNIFYRNRNEYDCIWFVDLMEDASIAMMVKAKIREKVSEAIKDKPDLYIWDMDGSTVQGKPDVILESKKWIVTFQEGDSCTEMRIYKKTAV